MRRPYGIPTRPDSCIAAAEASFQLGDLELDALEPSTLAKSKISHFPSLRVSSFERGQEIHDISADRADEKKHLDSPFPSQFLPTAPLNATSQPNRPDQRKRKPLGHSLVCIPDPFLVHPAREEEDERDERDGKERLREVPREGELAV